MIIMNVSKIGMIIMNVSKIGMIIMDVSKIVRDDHNERVQDI
jgi:hypothetical protein